MTRLIVNADDFARGPEIDRGILEAHRHGIVTTTTALVNMPGALTSIQSAQSSCPALGIGLHLNLTLGDPCTSSQADALLLCKEGRFHPVADWLENPRAIPLEPVEAEWRAQVSAFLSTGTPLDHLDSHHHIAMIREDIWELYLALADELGCGVRPSYPDDVSNTELERMYPGNILKHARTGALAALRQRSIPHPTHFFASFFDSHANLSHLVYLLGRLPSGVSELMCHPGYTSDSLKAASSYSSQRLMELEALTHPKTIQAIEDHEIDLVTYRQVWPQ